MAARRIGLVFGGGYVGLMGHVADAILAAGGHAIGVIPDALIAREIAHRGLPDLRVVHSLHERKALMADLAFTIRCWRSLTAP
jgi:predicted Rossmann-fold nucleotide-binding protein